MIKRTLCFSSPGSLRLHLCQLVWRGEDGRETIIPIEDIGILLVESPLITLSSALLQHLTETCIAVVFCDAAHLPSGYLLPYASHTLANRILQAQIAFSEAKTKRLWQQLVISKITNQAHAIKRYAPDLAEDLLGMSKRVRSGDPDNIEAQAARAHFTHFTTLQPTFRRDRQGPTPNAALNYGYAVLRAAVARALVASGLNPALGLFHRNQYNAFCLADDVMEPYRPFVDVTILDNLPAFNEIEDPTHLTPAGKRLILPFLTMDALIGENTSPLSNALQRTTASLAKCIQGEQSTLELPTLPT